LMLRSARNIARNICSIVLNRTAEDCFDPHPMVTEASDASARIGRPDASSSEKKSISLDAFGSEKPKFPVREKASGGPSQQKVTNR
jgi:hypothetical protein